MANSNQLKVDHAKAEQFFENAAKWLAKFNEIEERGGDKKTAEAADRRAQYWLDRANKAAGNY